MFYVSLVFKEYWEITFQKVINLVLLLKASSLNQLLIVKN